MKTYGMFVFAVAIVGLCSMSQAALIVNYAFEGNGNAAAGSAISTPATVTLGNFNAAGKIGDNAAELTENDGAYVSINMPNGGDTFPANNSGLFAGTISFWVNGATFDNDGCLWCSRGSDNSFNTGIYSVSAGCASMIFYPEGGPWESSASNSSIFDSTWHMVTVAYTATTGLHNTAGWTTYVDGASVGSWSSQLNGTTSASAFSAGGTAVLGDDVDGYGVPKSTTSGQNGDEWAASSQVAKFDDYAAWNTMLSGAQVKALYNLGGSDLNYGGADADTLFNVASSGVADDTADGLNWSRVTGLTGTAGGVSLSGNTWTVQLDGGVGAQAVVPEPSTLVLLAVAGLLVFAWKKR
jgi:hypothetical protein